MPEDYVLPARKPIHKSPQGLYICGLFINFISQNAQPALIRLA